MYLSAGPKEKIIKIHRECSCRIEISHPRDLNFSQVKFQPEGEISLSHIPRHTRLSGPYVSSLLEKSVPHRYPCEISVTNTR